MTNVSVVVDEVSFFLYVGVQLMAPIAACYVTPVFDCVFDLIVLWFSIVKNDLQFMFFVLLS